MDTVEFKLNINVGKSSTFAKSWTKVRKFLQQVCKCELSKNSAFANMLYFPNKPSIYNMNAKLSWKKLSHFNEYSGKFIKLVFSKLISN